MTVEPAIAAKSPAKAGLEAGKTYFWCACGQSQGQPFCDGSHKGGAFQPLRFTAEQDGPAFLCRCKRTANPPFCDGSHNKV